MGGGQARDMREAMIETFIQAVEEGVNLAVLVSDSTSTAAIGPFQQRYPDRVVNAGIAEQNLLGIAAGLSLGGIVPVTANAACFLVSRSNEQLKNDICYSQTNVKLVGLNAGVAYGSLGSTHHAIDDISIMRGLGSILILAPSDAREAIGVFRFALSHEGPVYIRMDSTKLPALHDDSYAFQPRRLDLLREGGDISIFSMGSVTREAAAAGEELARQGIHAEIVNVPSIRPVDREDIAHRVGRTGRALTVEEHSVHGGLGALVCETIAEGGIGATVVRLGFPEGEFAKAGPRAEIRRFYGIDAVGIVEKARAMLQGRQ